MPPLEPIVDELQLWDEEQMNRALLKVLTIILGIVGLSSQKLQAETTNPLFALGLILPLSGELADCGRAVQNGFEMARKDFPDRFSYIPYVYEDSQYDPKVALTALQHLRARGDIQLYHTWGVGPNEALLPVMNSIHLPVLAETSMKRAVVGKALAVRMARTGQTVADLLTRELARRGVKKIGLVVTSIPYHEDILESLRAYSRQRGISLEIIDTYQVSDGDFRASILAIKKSHFDVVGVMLLPFQIINFYKQAQELRFEGKTFGVDIFDSQSMIDACPPLINGALFTGTDVDPVFVKRYVETYGSDQRLGSAAQAYDTASLIGELFGNATSHSLSSEEIIRRFESVPPRSGVSGSYSFEDTAEGGKAFKLAVALREVREKKIVPVDRN